MIRGIRKDNYTFKIFYKEKKITPNSAAASIFGSKFRIIKMTIFNYLNLTNFFFLHQQIVIKFNTNEKLTKFCFSTSEKFNRICF